MLNANNRNPLIGSNVFHSVFLVQASFIIAQWLKHCKDMKGAFHYSQETINLNMSNYLHEFVQSCQVIEFTVVRLDGSGWQKFIF